MPQKKEYGFEKRQFAKNGCGHKAAKVEINPKVLVAY